MREGRASAGAATGDRSVPPRLAAGGGSQDIWPWLVLAASCVFLADVFVRRVQVNFQWLVPVLDAVRATSCCAASGGSGAGNDEPAAKPQGGGRTDRSKAAGPPRGSSRMPTLPGRSERDRGGRSEADDRRPLPPPTPTPSQSPKPKHETTYTSRLLKAKKQVWQDRAEDKDLSRTTKKTEMHE